MRSRRSAIFSKTSRPLASFRPVCTASLSDSAALLVRVMIFWASASSASIVIRVPSVLVLAGLTSSAISPAIECSSTSAVGADGAAGTGTASAAAICFASDTLASSAAISALADAANASSPAKASSLCSWTAVAGVSSSAARCSISALIPAVIRCTSAARCSSECTRSVAGMEWVATMAVPCGPSAAGCEPSTTTVPRSEV